MVGEVGDRGRPIVPPTAEVPAATAEVSVETLEAPGEATDVVAETTAAEVVPAVVTMRPRQLSVGRVFCEG